MAKFSILPSDAFQEQLSRLGPKLDEIAPRMIEAAQPIVAEAIKKRLAPHRDTGDLIRSVKGTKPKRGKTGGFSGRVTFIGYGKHIQKHKVVKIPNALKAAVLEYGTSTRPPHPFLEAAKRDANDSAVGRMQYVLNKELEKE